MEELLDGLDCSLRVSGMIGDSIMMGIVNSAMEEAYERIVGSREGGLECLNDKSRFCGLAIVQLEWCLRFLQEEVDACVAESEDQRERLVGDLRLTRDRIRRQLEETESAIAGKERELAFMNESESELRRALESKDEELRSLRTSLELERARCGGLRGGTNLGTRAGEGMVGDCEVALGELRNFIFRHIEDFSYKLVEAKTHISDLIQKLAVYYVSSVEGPKVRMVEEEGSCNFFDRIVNEIKCVRPHGGRRVQCPETHPNSDAEILRCVLRTDLDSMFRQLTLDMSILKRRLLLAFERADEAICLYKAALDEQQLRWAFEKEALYVLLGNFLKDVEENYCSKILGDAENTPPAFLNGNWSPLMTDFATLHSDLKQLAIQLDKQLETARFVESPTSDSKDLAKEKSIDHPNNFAAENERNHASTIGKKTQDTTRLRAKIYREKRLPFPQSDGVLRSMKTRITKIVSKLECVLEISSKIAVVSDDFQSAYDMNGLSLQDNLARNESAEKVNVFVRTSTGVATNVSQETTLRSTDADILEEIRHLKEDREDSYLKSMILEETNAIFFNVFVKELYLEFTDYKIETLLREDVCRLIFNEIMKERNCEVEICDFEKATMEEMDPIVFSHLVKDVKNIAGLGFKRHSEEYLSCPSIFFRGPSNNEDLVQGADELSMSFEVEEDVLPNPKSEIMEPQMCLAWNPQISAEQGPNHAETIDEDDAFCSATSKLEMGQQQITMSKMQLRELGSDVEVSLEEKQHAVDKLASLDNTKQDNEQSLHPQIKNRGEGCNEMQSVLTHLTAFSQHVLDLELVMYEKTRATMSRLEGLSRQLNLLVQQASSLRKTELLYRKAFIRRCYNLQTAEAEVDLLGDEVDSLLALLEKIYIALDYYSPVLQYYSGIMDVLKLIKKELFGDATARSQK